jgi:hypothetical protein
MLTITACTQGMTFYMVRTVSFHGLMLVSVLELELALACVWVSDWASAYWFVRTKAPAGTSGGGCPDHQMVLMNVDAYLPWPCRNLTVHLSCPCYSHR